MRDGFLNPNFSLLALLPFLMQFSREKIKNTLKIRFYSLLIFNYYSSYE